MYVSDIFWRPRMVSIQLITAELFRDRRWLLSSRTQQTLWWRHQGTVDRHMPFPNYKFQLFYYWQPKDHPETKCTCSEIRNYICALIGHEELKIRVDWRA